MSTSPSMVHRAARALVILAAIAGSVTLARAQATGGSFGGGAFEATEVTEPTEPPPTMRDDHWEWEAQEQPATPARQPRERRGGTRARGGVDTLPFLVGGAVLLVVIVVGVMLFGSIVELVRAAFRRSKASCEACGAIDVPKRGRCPRCGARMHDIV